ncbi:unnamed protein product [Lymnaea stagnalis]|uniref:Uncharacterized protein n=1 Tax=Lymnaea stagnalis TaxID=6523 RepID=A0AAV2HV08_LYMST
MMDSTHFPKHGPLLAYYFVDKNDTRQKARRADSKWLDTLCSQPVDEILRKYHARSGTGKPQAAMGATSSTRGEIALLHAWTSNMPRSQKHGQDDEARLAGDTASAPLNRLAVPGELGPSSASGANNGFNMRRRDLSSSTGIPNEDFLRPVIIACTISQLPSKTHSGGSKDGDTKQRRNVRFPRLNNDKKKMMKEKSEKIEEGRRTPGSNEASALAELSEDG